MMKNNKGFSMIELIVSFSITTIIVIMLLQIVLVLKEVYTKSSFKTALLNKQNIIVNLIYTDILDYGLNGVSTCGDYCVEFKFTNNSSKQLSYKDKVISYGDYNGELTSGTTVDKINIDNYTIDDKNYVISVSFPIYHKLFANNNFGINIVHYFKK